MITLVFFIATAFCLGTVDHGPTLLLRAIAKIDVETMEQLLTGTAPAIHPQTSNVEPVFVDNTDGMEKWKITPFFYAAFTNKADVLCLLRAHGANVNWRDEQGFTAVHAAAFKGAAEALSVLLSFNEVNLTAADADGLTPLLRACQGRTDDHLAAVRTLLQSGRASVDERDAQGRTCSQLLEPTAASTPGVTRGHPGMRAVLAEATARRNMARAAAEAAARRGLAEPDI
uniref:Uncharacterized protein n=1 Tax=Sexangularia sp. CB-2014 TaxID=1486929 RepID=A0A7S1VUP3_9EUKA